MRTKSFKRLLLFTFASLLAISLLEPVSCAGEAISLEFEILKRHFVEPFIEEKKIEERFGDQCALAVTEAVTEAISKPASIKLPKTLNSFHESLIRGELVRRELINYGEVTGSIETNELRENAEYLQGELMKELKKIGDKAIIPYSWKGAAPQHVVLIIERADLNKFNLIVANAGAGLNYHLSKADPDGHYPYLTKQWIEFKNIPSSEIFPKITSSGAQIVRKSTKFPDESWFFFVLRSMKIENLAVSAEKVASGPYSSSCTVADYFYGTFLANFRKYAVSPEASDEGFLPVHPKGDYAYSSLMMALSYMSGDDVNYQFNRMVLGQLLVEQFCKKYVDFKSNPIVIDDALKLLLGDGFDRINVHIFKTLSAAMAKQVLLYLEYQFPNSFKYASLMGKGRKTWASENVNKAVKDLSGNEHIVRQIRKSVDLSKQILKIVSNSSVNQDTVKISISSVPTSNCMYGDSKWNNYSTANDNGDPYAEMASTNINYVKARIAFDDEARIFRALGTTGYLIRDMYEILVAAKSFKEDWYNYIDKSNDEHLLLNYFDVAFNMIKVFVSSNYMPALEDFLILIYAQIIAWKAAVRLDQLKGAMGLGLENFKVPLAIQLHFEQNFLTNSMKFKWKIYTAREPSTYKEIGRLMAVLEDISKPGNSERLYGPKEFSTSSLEGSSNVSFDVSPLLKISDKSLNYQLLFGRLARDPFIDDAIKTYSKKITAPVPSSKSESPEMTAYKRRQYESKLDNQKKFLEKYKANENLIRIILVLMKENGNSLVAKYPQYYKLLSVLFRIYMAPYMGPTGYGYASDEFRKTSYTVAEDSYPSTTGKIEIEFTQPSQDYVINISYDYQPKGSLLNPMRDILGLHGSSIYSKENTTSLFYLARHTEAYYNDEKSDFYRTDVINYESWLNYVKSAASAKIFENVLFLYQSDRILNLPNVVFKKYELQDDNNIKYFEGFSVQHVKETFEALLKLISKDFTKIRNMKAQMMSAEERNRFVKRSVDIGIILAKYIARLDQDKVVSAYTAATMLSELYTIFFGLGRFSPNSTLANHHISLINLVLAYICSVPIRNPVTFLGNSSIKEIIDGKGLLVDGLSRQTLVRVHTFIMKMFYQSSPEHSMASTIHVIGFPYDGMHANENTFTSAILLVMVVPGFFKGSAFEFRYYDDGNIVVITDENKAKLAVQLYSGKYVKDDQVKPNLDDITSIHAFNILFPNDDKALAIKGSTAFFGSYLYHYIPNFKVKGNDYLLIRDRYATLSVYRKVSEEIKTIEEGNEVITVQEKWYRWTLNGEYYFDSFKYKCTTGYHVFSRCIEDDGYGDCSKFEQLVMKTDETSYLFKTESTINSNRIQFPKFQGKDEFWTLKTTGAPMSGVGRQLFKFTDNGIVLAESASNDLIVIYPALRLEGDELSPLILKGSMDGTIGYQFQVLNSPDYTVINNQTIDDVRGILGTLVVQKSDFKKFLLVPMKETGVAVKYDTPVTVEIVPILDNDLAPQTIKQRLILAYYSVLVSDFDLARAFLHPASSIPHNEPFKLDELNVIAYIARIKNTSVEVTAIKLIALMHALLNKLRFPLTYKMDGMSTILKDSIENPIKGSVANYVYYIRDLPEKFFVHKIFPEIAHESFYNLILSGAVRAPNRIRCYSGSKVDVDLKLDDAAPSLVWNFAEFNQNTIRGILLERYTSDKAFESYLNFISKVAHRRKGSCYNDSGYEIIANCYHEDKTIFSKIKGLADDYLTKKKEYEDAENAYNIADNVYSSALSKAYWNQNDPAVNSANVTKTAKGYLKSDAEKAKNKADSNLKTAFTTSLQTCTKMYKDWTLGIDFSSDFWTDSALLRNHMLMETKREEESAMKSVQVTSMAQDDDKKKFEQVSGAITDFFALISVKSSKALKSSFDPKIMKVSPVLRKLKNSIDEYIVGRGPEKYNDVMLSEERAAKVVEQLKSLMIYLEDRIYQMKILQERVRIEFTNLSTETAKAVSDKAVSQDIFQLNQHMHQRKLKTFDSIYSCYQKGSASCFHQKFPNVPKASCEVFRQKAFIYYSRQVLMDYFGYLYQIAEDRVKNAFQEVPTLTEDLGTLKDELSKISDFNERITNPTILNFEFRSRRFRLRSEQVRDVRSLAETKDPSTGLFKSMVIQRMMAAGKTLVLGTISVVTKALDSTKLSILVPPSSLYQSNTTSMQNRTYSFFKSKGITFQFPRFLLPDRKEEKEELEGYLVYLIGLMQNTMKSRNYMILSPDTLQSYLNSYIEMIIFGIKKGLDEQMLRILVKYGTIYDIFKNKSSIILDEIDMTMDPRKELNFPTQEKEAYNMVAATLLADLFEFAVFDEGVRAAGLDIWGNNQASLTKTDFLKCRKLILKYIEKQLKIPYSLWTKHILNQNPPELEITRENIMDFLSNPKLGHKSDWIKNIYDSGNLLIKANALAIVKVQLYSGMEEALKGSVNQNYGSSVSVRPGTFYAVPYVAANTPSPTSEFADRWETLMKTLLMYSSAKVRKEVIPSIIDYIQVAINGEMSKGLPQKETATAKNLSLMFGKNIDYLDMRAEKQADVDFIYKGLETRSPAALRILFSYALDEVLAGMTFAIEQVTTNAINMTSMFGSVQGYSGTIDNVNILPHQVVAEAYQDHLVNEKNNGGISLKLIKDTNNGIVPQIPDSDLRKEFVEVVRVILKSHGGLTDSVSALIDAGAFFKDYKNKEVAIGIVENLDHIKAVLYYDEDSNQLEFIIDEGRDSEGKLQIRTGHLDNTDPDSITKATGKDISQRFTFYDQRHITGSDILQPKSATAIMTIGARVLLRDILQGTLRMRQFMTSQKVYLVTTVSAVKFYQSKTNSGAGDGDVVPAVKVSDMLTLGAINEDDKQIAENEKLAFVKIDNECRSFILTEVTQIIKNQAAQFEKSPHKDKLLSNTRGMISLYFKKFRDLFLRSVKEKPLEWLRTVEYDEPRTVIEKYIKYRLTQFKELDQMLKKAKVKGQYDFFSEETKSGKRYMLLKSALQKFVSADGEEKGSLLSYLHTQIKKRVSLGEGSEVQMQVQSQILSEDQIKACRDVNKSYSSLVKPNPIDFKKLDKITSQLLIDSSTPSEINVVTLQALLEDPSHKPLNTTIGKAALMTFGRNVAVSRDLVDIVERYKNEPYQIYTNHTWEGTHLLVQVPKEKDNFFVHLLSLKDARKAYNELMRMKKDPGHVSFESNIWLCDLSGRITASTDSKSEKHMNILDILPKCKYLVFDALIFNGSLSQVLDSPLLNGIFNDQWLKSPLSFKDRALFVRVRMELLLEKAFNTFDLNDPTLAALVKKSQGLMDTSNSSKKSSSGNFTKVPLEQRDQDEFYESFDGAKKPEASEEFDSKHFEPATLFQSAVKLTLSEATPFKYGRVDFNSKYDRSPGVGDLLVDENEDKATKYDFKIKDEAIHTFKTLVTEDPDLKPPETENGPGDDDFEFESEDEGDGGSGSGSSNTNSGATIVIVIVISILVVGGTAGGVYYYKNNVLTGEENQTNLGEKPSGKDQLASPSSPPSPPPTPTQQPQSLSEPSSLTKVHPEEKV